MRVAKRNSVLLGEGQDESTLPSPTLPRQLREAHMKVTLFNTSAVLHKKPTRAASARRG